MPRLEDLELQIKQTAANTSGIKNITDALGKLASSARATSTSAKAIKSLGDSMKSVSASGVTSQIKATSEQMEKMSTGASEAAKGVESFKKTVKTTTRHTSGFGKSLLTTPWNAFKSKIVGVLKPLSNLYNSFKRIAMYRALRTALKEITQGFATGIKHLYAWSGLAGNSFKGTMDSLATSMNYLRNSLGAMVSPLLDALAPAVDVLADKFVDLINLVNQFFATMTGATSWRKALKTQKEYADNTDDAAKAQARLNHQLMAFDELNNISVSNPSGRGGGGNNDDVSADDFEEVPLPDWAKSIKDAIDRGDWAGAGSKLAEKLNNLVNNWDAKGFGNRLGEKFESALEFFNSFMEGTDWESVGTKLAGFVTGFLDKIDAEQLGKAITQKFKAIVSTIKGFVWNVDLTKLATALGTAFNEIFSQDFMNDLGMTIAGMFNQVVTFVSTWVDTVDWEEDAKNLIGGLLTAIGNINWSNTGETIGKLVAGISTFINNAISEIIKNPGVLVDAVKDLIGGLFKGIWGEDGSGLLNVVGTAGLVLGLKALFSGALSNSGLISSLKTNFTSLLASAGLSGGMAGVTITCAVGLVWGVSEIVDNCKKYGVDRGLWMSLSIADPEMIAKLGLDTTGFVDSFSSAWEWLVGQLGVLGPILKAMGIDLPDIPSPEPTKPAWMTQFTSGLKGISTAATNAGKKVDQLPPDDDVVSKFQTQTDKEKGYLNGDKNSLKSAAKDANDNGIKKIGPTKTDGNNFWTKVKDNFTTHLTGDKDSFVAKAGVAGTAGVKRLTPTKTDGNTFWSALNTNLTTHLTGDKNSFVAKADVAGTASINRLTPDKTDGNNYWTKLKDNFTTHLTGDKSSIVASADSAGSKTVSKLTPSKTDGNNFWTSLKNNFATHLTGDKNSISSAAGTASDKVAGIGTELGEITGTEYNLDLGYTEVTDAAKDAKKLYDNLSDSSKTWTIKVNMKGEKGGEFYFVPPAAEGGMFDMGSMFVAGEAGPELVGTINGRTGVVSANEISGIGDAIYDTGETEAALLREQNALLRQLLAKSGQVTLAPNAAAGRWVAQAQTAYARATGG